MIHMARGGGGNSQWRSGQENIALVIGKSKKTFDILP